MRRIILILSSFTVMLASCEKNYQPFTDTPIIESYLSPGAHPVIKIYRQIPFESDVTYSSDNIDSLAVTLKYGSCAASSGPARVSCRSG